MYRKHIEQFVSVSLKYFFDCDFSLCSNAFLIALVIAGSARLLFLRIADEFQDGIATVKEDALTIKACIEILRERWENSEIHERMTNNVRSLKNNFLDKLLTSGKYT